MVQFHYRFLAKVPGSERVMSKGIVMMQDPSIRPKFSSSPTNSLTYHVTLPVFPNNNAGSLFDLVQETQSEQFSSVR
jgi:hypothetical protein